MTELSAKPNFVLWFIKRYWWGLLWLVPVCIFGLCRIVTGNDVFAWYYLLWVVGYPILSLIIGFIQAELKTYHNEVG